MTAGDRAFWMASRTHWSSTEADPPSSGLLDLAAGAVASLPGSLGIRIEGGASEEARLGGPVETNAVWEWRHETTPILDSEKHPTTETARLLPVIHGVQVEEQRVGSRWESVTGDLRTD